MRRAGFSMVEVVMALGIVSFALVSIFGLLSVGLMASKQSGSDTVIASMSAQITSRLQSGKDTITVGTPLNYYFDNQGQLQVDGSDIPLTTSTADTLYQCVVNGRLPNASTEVADLGSHLILTTLTFSWPTKVPDPNKRPNHEVLHATLAK